ncbi:MAG TPA: nitroreductase family protein [Acidimicrobiia bacterium]|jgi:nitroreductase
MEFKQVIGSRRSIRYFEPKRPVEDEKIQVMLEAANRSSRSINADYIKAVVVLRDELEPGVLEQLKTPTTQVSTDLAPVYIFFYGDMSYGDRAQESLKELVDVGAINASHGWSHAYVDEVVYAQVLRPLLSDPTVAGWMCTVECGLAINQAMLAGVDEGLGVCLHAFNIPLAKEVLKVPDHWIPMWMLLVGYPAESPDAGGARPRRPLSDHFYRGQYGNPWQEIPEVTERLRNEGMIQAPAPLPNRREEIRELARRFGLPE